MRVSSIAIGAFAMVLVGCSSSTTPLGGADAAVSPSASGGDGGSSATAADAGTASQADGGAASATGGGGCTYQEYPGTATIKTLVPAGASESNCTADAVKVTFDFQPSDAQAPLKYKLPTQKDTGRSYTIYGGQNPSRACVDDATWKVGTKVSAKRREILTGTCTPVIFELDDPKLRDCKCS